MTWFCWVAWSVRTDLLCSVKLDARRLLVNVQPVLDSTSVLCSCNLTPNFLNFKFLGNNFGCVLSKLSYSYNGGLIESHTRSIEPRHFQ